MRLLLRIVAFFTVTIFSVTASLANSETTAPAGAVALASYAPVPAVHMVANDHGGSIISYAQRLARLRSGDALVVFSGRCASACTMFLSLERSQTCIAPGATFLFHSAHGASREMNEWGTDYLLRQYPDWVRSWIVRNGGLTARVIRMDYAYASRFMRTCRVAST